MTEMKKRILSLSALIFIIVLTLALASCSQWDTPYVSLDKEGNTVSVKFVANGGFFADTNGVTVVDVFSKELDEISLIAPDDDRRGNNVFEISKPKHSLAGWWVAEVSEDTNGDPIYTPTKKWDFEKDTLKIDPNKTYSSEEPALTLCAVWLPYVTFEYYAKDANGALVLIGTTESLSLEAPEWDLDTGKINYHNFLKISGKTFGAAYSDEGFTTPIDETINGEYDLEAGVCLTPTIKIYTEWLEGDWYKISTAAQFYKNASPKASYEILADLDFQDVTWPQAIANSEFTGTIIGNGHKISNVTVSSNPSSTVKGGLFGALSAKATIKDLSFENVSYTINGTRKNELTIGLLAGVNDGANLENVTLSSSTLIVSADIYTDFRAQIENEDFKIGVIFGEGDIEGFDISSVTVKLGEENLGEFVIDEENGRFGYPETT